MKRQPISQAKANRIARNYSNIKALAKMIEYIHWQECDADFRSPIIHAHVSKVLQSATAVEQATSAFVMTAVGQSDRGESYVSELLILLNYVLENLNLEQLQLLNQGTLRLTEETKIS